MNAIPQRAYDNYERIQIPRRINNDTQRGRVSDMEAYRMQKIAAERRRLQQQDEIHTARRVGVQQGRPVQARQQQAARRPVQARQQTQRPAQVQARKTAEQMQRQRYAAAQRSGEVPGERYGIRQTGVKNIVGGRRLTPAYEGAYVGGNEYSYRARQTGRYERSYSERYDRRNEYARPRQAASYGGYAAPAPRKYARGYERTSGIENTAYNGVKPIAVEYESPKKKGIISTILLIAVVFAVLTGIVIRYASISDLSNKNVQIQTQNEALKDELDKVKMENALSQDLNSIQQKASTELGMYYPTDDQIVYLEPEADDAAAAPVESVQPETQEQEAPVEVQGNTGGETNFMEDLQGFFGDMMEALKGWFQA